MYTYQIPSYSPHQYNDETCPAKPRSEFKSLLRQTMKTVTIKFKNLMLFFPVLFHELELDSPPNINPLEHRGYRHKKKTPFTKRVASCRLQVAMHYVANREKKSSIK